MTKIKVRNLKIVDGRLTVIPKWGGLQYYCAIANALTGKREIIQGELQRDKIYDYKVLYNVPRDLLQPSKLIEFGTYFKNYKGKDVFEPFFVGAILNTNAEHVEVLEIS